MLVSAGWDNNVFVYDMRYRGPVHSIYGPHVCGDAIDFKRDGYTMVCGSYRQEDAIEVYDLRMMKKSRVIAWQGTGSTQLFPQESESTDMEDVPITDTEAENTEVEERKGAESTEASTMATKKRLSDKPTVAPFLYTTMISKNEDLLYAGGAGKNEMRIFDFDTGNIVALISNLPKSVLCGALGNVSN